MSDNRAKWFRDLTLVRERIEGRAASCEKLSNLFRELDMDKVANELELTWSVLKECSTSVGGAIEDVRTQMGRLSLEKK
jgi:hypothetical protein